MHIAKQILILATVGLMLNLVVGCKSEPVDMAPIAAAMKSTATTAKEANDKALKAIAEANDKAIAEAKETADARVAQANAEAEAKVAKAEAEAANAKVAQVTDTDGDGIMDSDDDCWDKPGVKSDLEGKNGCPLEAADPAAIVEATPPTNPTATATLVSGTVPAAEKDIELESSPTTAAPATPDCDCKKGKKVCAKKAKTPPAPLTDEQRDAAIAQLKSETRALRKKDKEHDQKLAEHDAFIAAHGGQSDGWNPPQADQPSGQAMIRKPAEATAGN